MSVKGNRGNTKLKERFISMKVILTKNVENVGTEGKIMDVRDGFARNFLLPRGFAVAATEGYQKVYAEKLKSREKRHEKELQELGDIKQKLEAITLTLTAKAGQDGKLFGSITADDICSQLKKENIKLAKRNIDLKSPLKNIGSHEVRVKLGGGISAKLALNVEAES